MRHDRTTTGRTRQIARTLLTVTALLGAVTTHPAVAAPTPDAAVTALLRDAQPGARYTLPGSVAETCDRLAAAGLTLLSVPQLARPDPARLPRRHAGPVPERPGWRADGHPGHVRPADRPHVAVGGVVPGFSAGSGGRCSR